MNTKRIFLALVLVLVVSGLSFLEAAKVKDTTNWKSYKGAWFEILYPDDFLPSPSLKCKNHPEGFDSVFFAPLNKRVEFYVWAPLFTGEATDLALDPKTETQVSYEEKKKKNVLYRTTLIVNKAGTYTRKIIDVTELCDRNKFTRVCFGMKYADQQTLEQFEKVFLKFQKSLVRLEK